MKGIGRMDDRLRWNAADMEAGSAEAAVLDKHRVEPERARADRRDIAAGAAADDQDLAVELAHLTPRHRCRVGCHPRESGGPGAASGRALQAERSRLDARFRGYDIQQCSMNRDAGASRSARRR